MADDIHKKRWGKASVGALIVMIILSSVGSAYANKKEELVPAVSVTAKDQMVERADDLAAALGAPEPADVLTGRRRRSGPRRVVLAVGRQEAVSPHSRETVLVRTGGGARWRIEVDTAGMARVEPLDVGVRNYSIS